MIEVRISFRDAYTNHIEYVEQQLTAAGFPPYPMRAIARGMVKHWFEDPPGEFVYQWIPYEEYTISADAGDGKREKQHDT